MRAVLPNTEANVNLNTNLSLTYYVIYFFPLFPAYLLICIKL